MGITHIFSSKHSIYGQADPQIWPKMINSGATLAQITCTHDCSQLQKHAKVKITSQARIMRNGMGIVHGILSQPQNFLPSWPPILAKNKQVQSWFGPHCMYVWLHFAAEALQSQNEFTSKVYKAQDRNCTWIFYPNTPFSAKLTPKFGKNRHFDG